MGDVYRVEVSFDNVAMTLPAANTLVGWFPPLTFTFLEAFDGNHAIWAIRCGLRWNNYNAGLNQEYQAYAELLLRGDQSTSGIDAVFTVITTLAQANGNAGAAFLSGGTLAIEKDEAANEIRFFTPVGNFTDTLSSYTAGFVNLQNAEPIRGRSHGHWLTSGSGAVQTTNISDLQWFGFWSSINGTRFRGAPLSSAQPGNFTAWNFGFGLDGGSYSSTQLSTRFQTIVRFDAPGFTVGFVIDPSRTWNGGDTIPLLPLSVDIDLFEEHGVLLAAYSSVAANDTLFLGTSYDGGITWSESIIHQELGTVVDSISLTHLGQQLVACWWNGTEAVQAFSWDFGHSWAGPAVIIPGVSLPSDNFYPRLFVDRRHGLCYYFFVDVTGLKVYRDALFGAEPLDPVAGLPAPVLIFTGAPALQVDAAIGYDGSITVQWTSFNVVNIMKSTNYGKTWTNPVSAATDYNRPRHIFDARQGLSHFVVLTGNNIIGNAVQVRSSENDGVTFLTARPYGDVYTGCPDHQPDIELLPDGNLIVGYFTTLNALSFKLSYDIGITWS